MESASETSARARQVPPRSKPVLEGRSVSLAPQHSAKSSRSPSPCLARSVSLNPVTWSPSPARGHCRSHTRCPRGRHGLHDVFIRTRKASPYGLPSHRRHRSLPARYRGFGPVYATIFFSPSYLPPAIVAAPRRVTIRFVTRLRSGTSVLRNAPGTTPDDPTATTPTQPPATYPVSLLFFYLLLLFDRDRGLRGCLPMSFRFARPRRLLCGSRRSGGFRGMKSRRSESNTDTDLLYIFIGISNFLKYYVA